jgi:hypothetical protein
VADPKEPSSRDRGVDVGLFIVAGAAIGSVVFAITQNAGSIGLGAALGVVVGATWDAMRSRKERDRKGMTTHDDYET